MTAVVSEAECRRRVAQVERERDLIVDMDNVAMGKLEAMIHQVAAQRDLALEALDCVMIGGNHLATYKTERWPDPETHPQDALRTLCATQEFDMWCCWRAIMLARAMLAHGTEARRVETHLAAPSQRDDGPVGEADAPQ